MHTVFHSKFPETNRKPAHQMPREKAMKQAPKWRPQNSSLTREEFQQIVVEMLG